LRSTITDGSELSTEQRVAQQERKEAQKYEEEQSQKELEEQKRRLELQMLEADPSRVSEQKIVAKLKGI
jgi:hypothetical protein